MYNLVVQVALAFLNDTCSSTHGRVCVSSIFITPSGEWKLGGFELLSSSKDDAPVLYVRLIIVWWREKDQIILSDEREPFPIDLRIYISRGQESRVDRNQRVLILVDNFHVSA